jgi:phage terminase large subunit
LRIIDIPAARVFQPLRQPSRYKGAWGGRGSGKSHFFGELLVERCLTERGTLAVCIRETQKTLAQSSKCLVEDKISALGVGSQFRILADKIETPGGGLIIFNGMQDHNAESIKSLEGYKIAWIEEAQTLSARSLSLLRPTIRTDGSEIWASWNPRRKKDAIDAFLRLNTPDNAIVVQANWRDNPWWNEVLEQERLLDLEKYPDRYAHIWEGDYVRAHEGSYFERDLARAKAEDRLSKLSLDPVLPLRAYWDLGFGDATAIWIVQFVGTQINVLDYIEGVNQPLGYYLSELRARGYERAICVLPHDGVNSNTVSTNQVRDLVDTLNQAYRDGYRISIIR